MNEEKLRPEIVIPDKLEEKAKIKRYTQYIKRLNALAQQSEAKFGKEGS